MYKNKVWQKDRDWEVSRNKSFCAFRIELQFTAYNRKHYTTSLHCQILFKWLTTGKLQEINGTSEIDCLLPVLHTDKEAQEAKCCNPGQDRDKNIDFKHCVCILSKPLKQYSTDKATDIITFLSTSDSIINS